MNEKTLKNVNIRWQSLAAIDSALTSKYIDSCDVRAHKIFQPENLELEDDAETVRMFLENQYVEFLKVVSFQAVSYIPSTIFSQVGVFAKTKIDKKSCISGLAGFLSELPDEDHVIDVNDFSLITTTRKIAQTFLMLGPVSFAKFVL